jgi:integrase
MAMQEWVISASLKIFSSADGTHSLQVTATNVTARRLMPYGHSRMGRVGSRALASVDRKIRLLSRIFTLAIEREEVQINPCKEVKMPNSGNTVIRYLTPDEEERLLQVLTDRRCRLLDIVVIDLHTGMRRTEILTLHKKQIDFIRCSIEIIETKNGKPRSVPTHQALRPIL